MGTTLLIIAGVIAGYILRAVICHLAHFDDVKWGFAFRPKRP
jgi:hypothetical protein